MKMKKAMKLVSLVLAVVMLLGCLAACSSKSATTDSTASTDTASTDTAASDSSEASSDGGEIVIALISNTTGDYAQYGQPVRDGAMLYINQLNANGGINGKQVKVLEYDDKGDGVEAVNAYNLACDNGITAVQALVNGQIDCVVIDSAPAAAFVASNPGLTILETEYVTENYAIGMAKGNTALLEAINKALDELTADGTIQAIVDKYIAA